MRIHEGSGEPSIARLEALIRDTGDRRWDNDGISVQGFSQVTVRDVREGRRYDLRFRVISDFGRPSRWVENTGVEVIGAAERPLPPEELHLDIIRGTALLSWEPSPSIDVAGYIIKHSRSISGATWANAIFLEEVGRKRTSVHLPLQVGTYLVKSFDQRGRRSQNAAAVVTSVPRVLRENFVIDQDAHPGWTGTKTNVVFDATLSGIRLVETPEEIVVAEAQPTVSIEVQTGVPMVVQAVPAVVKATGDWESPTPIDLGAVFTARVRAKLQIGAVTLGTDMFAWPDFFGVEDVFGGVDDSVTVRAYVATTNDNPAGTPTWSAWKRIRGAGDFTARGFKFRLRLISTATAATPVVEEATFVVDMDDRVWSTEVTLAAGGTAVSFVPPFYVRPTVGVTIQDGANGDRPKITSLTRSGMTVQVLNSAGSGVARSVEIMAKAYGDEGA